MTRLRKATQRFIFLAAVLALVTATATGQAGSAPVIQKGLPAIRLVIAGERVRFEVSATSDAPMGFQWRSSGPIVAGGDSWIETTFPLDELNEQHVSVVVYNRYGETNSTSRVFSRTARTFSFEQTNIIAGVGQPIFLWGHAFSEQSFPLTNQWYKDGVPLIGKTNTGLAFSEGVQLGDAGIYTMKSTNEAGPLIIDPIRLWVVSETSKPVVMNPPPEIHLIPGETRFVKVEGGSMAESKRFVRQQDGTMTGDLTVENYYRVQPINGQIFFVMTNAFGAVTSAVSQVIVHPASEKIVFAGGAEKAVVMTPGEPVELQAELLQGINVDLQWYRGEQPIAGEKGLRLNLPKVYGGYSLHGSNELGVVVQRFVTPIRPVFWQPLGGWTGKMGEEATLQTKGSEVKAIQWYREGVKIEGATNETLQLTIAPDTVGAYTVTLSNEFGTSVSNPAQIMARGLSETPRDFRVVQRDAGVHSALIEGEAMTYVSGVKVYRWHNGNEIIFDATEPVAELGNESWAIAAATTEQDGSIFVLLEKGPDVFPGISTYALIEKNAAGVRVIARSGDLIPGTITRGLTRIGYPVRQGGKVAFVAGGTGSYQALLVWNGAVLEKWADSDHAELNDWATANVPGEMAFDGSAAVFSARFDVEDFGVYRVNGPGNIQKIARSGDLIPGEAKVIQGIFGAVAMQGDKTLFKADWQWSIFSIPPYHTLLLEHAGDRTPAIRVIAQPGTQVEGGARFHSLLGNRSEFGYLPNGDIWMWATTGRFKNPRITVTEPIQDESLTGLFRFRDGVWREEVSALNRIAGRPIGTVYFPIMGGNNEAAFQSPFGFLTTLAGPTRPTDTIVKLVQLGGEWRAEWTGDGVLQATQDLTNWVDVLSTPWTLPSEYTSGTWFFRVFHP